MHFTASIFTTVYAYVTNPLFQPLLPTCIGFSVNLIYSAIVAYFVSDALSACHDGANPVFNFTADEASAILAAANRLRELALHR